MKKLMIYGLLTVVLFLAFGACLRTSATKETKTVIQTGLAQQPAQSTKEFAERYRSANLTPSQQKLVAAGFYPDKVHSITINKK